MGFVLPPSPSLLAPGFIDNYNSSIPFAILLVQAAQALCKRFINIDQFFMFWGPGGVGLSVYTAFLAAMYGPKNHKYFDPNIFYQDEELRKMVELLVGAIMYTGVGLLLKRFHLKFQT